MDKKIRGSENSKPMRRIRIDIWDDFEGTWKGRLKGRHAREKLETSITISARHQNGEQTAKAIIISSIHWMHILHH